MKKTTARLVAVALAVFVAGCSAVERLLGKETNPITVVKGAPRSPAPERSKRLFGASGTIVYIEASPTPATPRPWWLTPEPLPPITWYPPTAAPTTRVTPTPYPGCDDAAGDKPKLWASVAELAPGVREWSFRTACWAEIFRQQALVEGHRGEAPGTDAPVPDEIIRPHMVYWDLEEPVNEYRFTVVDDELLVEARNEWSIRNYPEPGVDRAGGEVVAHFRLTELEAEKAIFRFEATASSDAPLPPRFNYAAYFRGVLGSLSRIGMDDIYANTKDVVNVEVEDKRGTLSERAEIRWGEQSVDFSCLPQERTRDGVNLPEMVEVKTAVGKRAVVFALASRLLLDEYEEPDAVLFVGDHEHRWGKSLKALFPYNAARWTTYYGATSEEHIADITYQYIPRYLERRNIFVLGAGNSNERYGKMFSVTEDALLQGREEPLVSCRE